MEKSYEIKLELRSNNTNEAPLNYFRGDRNTMPLTIRLTDSQKPAALPQDVQAELTFELKSGVYTDLCTIVDRANGVLSYKMKDFLVAEVAETVVCTLTLISGDKRLTWQQFSYRVKKSTVTDPSPVPDDPLEPWMQSVTAGLGAASGKADAAMARMQTHEQQIADKAPLANPTFTGSARVDKASEIKNLGGKDFASGVANQKFDVVITPETTAYVFKLRAGSGWSGANGMGYVEKQFTVYTDSATAPTAFRTNASHYTNSAGSSAACYAVGTPRLEDGKIKIAIVNRSAGSNYCGVILILESARNYLATLPSSSGFSLSDVYTADETVYDKPYISAQESPPVTDNSTNLATTGFVKYFAPISGTVTLTGSTPQTIAMANRPDKNYIVGIESAKENGQTFVETGAIVPSDKLTNAFKLTYTGNAASVTAVYYIMGSVIG